jgi:hypothetical protein
MINTQINPVLFIIIITVMCGFLYGYCSYLGRELRRENASLELKLAGLNKKYNDLYHQFNRHIHNDVHDTEELKIKLDELRTIVIGDAGQITVEEEPEDDDEDFDEEPKYIPCTSRDTFKVVNPKKDKPIC